MAVRASSQRKPCDERGHAPNATQEGTCPAQETWERYKESKAVTHLGVVAIELHLWRPADLG